MKKPVPVFQPGDLVFAKVRGYPAWPARVTGPADDKSYKYHVFFYGTYETAVCKREDVWMYSEATKNRFSKQKRKGFAEGIYEIENNPDIAIRTPPEPVANPLPESIPSTPDVTPTVEAVEAATPTASDDVMSVTQQQNSMGKGRAKKRKCDVVSTPSSEPAAKRMAEGVSGGTPTTSVGDSAKTSRSGRQIKPKKFLDDPSSPVKATTPSSVDSGSGKKRPEPRKMWVHVKATGDMLEINLDKDRPVRFENKDAEIQWERASAKNALKFKENVEAGNFIPKEILCKLEEKEKRTPEEEELLRKELKLASQREKMRWLKVEQRLIDLDIAIKTAVHFEHPDMRGCLALLDEFNSLPVAPLMLKKQPDIVTTIRKLRKYIGPQTDPEDPKVAQEWSVDAERIRLRADAVFLKIQSCFDVPEGASFWDIFESDVVDFRNITKDMDRNQVLHMVSDPSNRKKAKK